jgi:hypothetical protein
MIELQAAEPKNLEQYDIISYKQKRRYNIVRALKQALNPKRTIYLSIYNDIISIYLSIYRKTTNKTTTNGYGPGECSF